MSKSEKATKIVFWLAFGAFLAMSIPHLAWLFRFYEPKQDGYDGLWWVISYGVAFSIDVLICWLSYTRSEQSTTKLDALITWSFIFLLALLSWYCNWIFAESMIGVNVWSIQLGFGWTIGTLTPLIVSAIPIFMIAYTYMSRKIIGAKARVKTLEELEQEAQEADRKAQALLAIKAAHKQVNSTVLEDRKELIKQAFTWRKIGEVLPTLEKLSRVEELPKNGSETFQESTSFAQGSDLNTEPDIEVDAEVLAVVTQYPMIASWLSDGRKSAAKKEIIEAVKVNGWSEKMVSYRMQKRIIKATKRNPNLYTIDSVIQWLKEEQKPRDTAKLAAIRLVQ